MGCNTRLHAAGRVGCNAIEHSPKHTLPQSWPKFARPAAGNTLNPLRVPSTLHPQRQHPLSFLPSGPPLRVSKHLRGSAHPLAPRALVVLPLQELLEVRHQVAEGGDDQPASLVLFSILPAVDFCPQPPHAHMDEEVAKPTLVF